MKGLTESPIFVAAFYRCQAIAIEFSWRLLEIELSYFSKPIMCGITSGQLSGQFRLGNKLFRLLTPACSAPDKAAFECNHRSFLTASIRLLWINAGYEVIKSV